MLLHFNRLVFTLFTALFISTALHAQMKITGRLLDNDTNEPIEQVTVKLLKKDSTLISGTTTDEDGLFYITHSKAGQYIMRFSCVGYHTIYNNITLEKNKEIALGTIKFKSDAKLLDEAVVSGQAVTVRVVEDTLEYNANAIRTPEGSVIEELVKRLPGAQVDENGKVTINGQEVKKIKVDGKEFMTGDTETAMKNLPTNIVNKVKAYNEKSDLSKITGIDDGNDEMTLDFNLKPGMNHGFMSDADLSYGTHERTADRLMLGYMNTKIRTINFFNFNNTNNRGFDGRGFGGSGNGINTTKMFATNWNYNSDDKLKIDGSVRWRHNDSDVQSRSASENYVSQNGAAFSNSRSNNYSRNDSWNFNMRLEWKPDTMTNILFRPNFSINKSDSRGWNNSGSYNQDPYSITDDPLYDIAALTAVDALVNTRDGQSISYNSSKSIGSMLQINRKLGNKGRNITLRGDFSYSKSEGNSFSINNVHLYQVKSKLMDEFGIYPDSTYQTNRYNTQPNKSLSYTAQTTYSEPLWRGAFLQFNYQFRYSYRENDRKTFDFSDLGETFFGNLTPTYRGWNSYLDRLHQQTGKPFTDFEDTNLSRYQEDRTYTHQMELTLRQTTDYYNLSVGVMAEPQHRHYKQNYLGIKADATRNTNNISPTLNFRYRFNKQTNLQVRYRGSTQQPDMSQLLDIEDNTDPLNISRGNPGLKPSFTNNLNADYNTYVSNHQQQFSVRANYSTVHNSISNMVEYDNKTGGRITRPENINGNWNANGDLSYSFSIDTVGVWSIRTNTSASYNNMVGYISTSDKDTQLYKTVINTTTSLRLNERLGFVFRNDWLEVEADGSINYRNSRNPLAANNSNQNVYEFSYGFSTTAYLPWNLQLSTNIHENSRRGMSEKSMNTNELVWNAQISRSFLKKKNLSVMLQCYDILQQKSNISRNISAMLRSDTWSNGINSYGLIHIVYKFFMFGGKMGTPDQFAPGRRGENRGGYGGVGRGSGGPGGGRPTMM